MQLARAWGLQFRHFGGISRDGAARTRGVCPVTVVGVPNGTPSGAARARVGFAPAKFRQSDGIANPTRARAAPFSFRKFFLKLRGQTLRALAALFGGGKFSTTESKPHERESYSFQNSVAVFIMLVMRSNSKPSSRVFLYCPRYPCIMPKNPYIY